MILTLFIPDDLAAEFGGDSLGVSGQVQADLAVMFYMQRRVSLGRAVEMSGMLRGEFERLLGERQVTRDYAVDDFVSDLAWASAK